MILAQAAAEIEAKHFSRPCLYFLHGIWTCLPVSFPLLSIPHFHTSLRPPSQPTLFRPSRPSASSSAFHCRHLPRVREELRRFKRCMDFCWRSATNISTLGILSGHL